MRKFLLTAAAAVSAMAVAAPAAAQWAPAPNYGHGYNQNYGHVRSLQARVDNLQRQIYQLDRRNVLSNREARRLLNDANGIENRLRRAGRNGLNYAEARDIQNRIQRLEWSIQREARDGNNWRNDRYGQGYGYPDRDRDGRDDRREDDRGWRHD
jgi:predicted RNase H-like nuclease (RuvC/YqgF family)